MPPISITPAVVRQLSIGRWLIPVLAEMAREEGSRFAALAYRLSVSKSILSQSLDWLERDGWIARNPGHGHPLRPEYHLTESGRQVGRWCQSVMDQRQAIGLESNALGRWSLPLILELREGDRRFSALQRGLVPITPRALSLALRQLRVINLVDRLRVEPLYGLTASGREFAQRVLPPA